MFYLLEDCCYFFKAMIIDLIFDLLFTKNESRSGQGGHGRSWEVTEGHGRSREVTARKLMVLVLYGHFRALRVHIEVKIGQSEAKFGP